MPDENSKYSSAESVQEIAQNIIPNWHPHLAEARIEYLFTEKPAKRGGRELFGKASKVSGRWSHLTELDFVVEVALPLWNDLSEVQRNALVDHLLEHCAGEENEETGEIKWGIREPELREFATVLHRHGAWNDTLVSLVRVASAIDLDTIVDEALGDSEQVLDLTVDESETDDSGS